VYDPARQWRRHFIDFHHGLLDRDPLEREGIYRERELERHDLESELRRLETAAKATVDRNKLLNELREDFQSWYDLLTVTPEHTAAARQIIRKLLVS
jgi:hypothetical protein